MRKYLIFTTSLYILSLFLDWILFSRNEVLRVFIYYLATLSYIIFIISYLLTHSGSFIEEDMKFTKKTGKSIFRSLTDSLRKHFYNGYFDSKAVLKEIKGVLLEVVAYKSGESISSLSKLNGRELLEIIESNRALKHIFEKPKVDVSEFREVVEHIREWIS